LRLFPNTAPEVAEALARETSIKVVRLTSAGEELVGIVHPTPNAAYRSKLIDWAKPLGLIELPPDIPRPSEAPSDGK
jgi:hypothetical protein